MNDPAAAAKLFADLDPAEDTMGKQSLSRVDFRSTGFFFPSKEYTSVIEAQSQIELNKVKLH